MCHRNEQRHFCAIQLAALIIKPGGPPPKKVEIADALIVIDNLVDYTIAVAQDRIAQAAADSAALRLAEATLRKHAETAPAPQEG